MRTRSPAIAVTLTNTGTSNATVSAVGLTGADFRQSHDCATLAPAASCTIQVRLVPDVRSGDINAEFPVASTLVIESTAPGSPHYVRLAGIAERSLVTHFYRSILQRAPDASGAGFWRAESTRLAQFGANVNEAWFAMAAYFFASPEYAAFNRDDAGFVADLYRTFLDREPDSTGLAFWTTQVAQGLPREVVLAAFMFSTEFNTLATGIFGNTAAAVEVDVVMDFFRGALARLPDDSGLVAFSERLRRCSGNETLPAIAESLAGTFLEGTEYAGRQRSDAQFIGDLYNTLLRRGGDLQGFQFWKQQMQASSRTAIRQAFLASAEFQARLAAAAGCPFAGERRLLDADAASGGLPMLGIAVRAGLPVVGFMDSSFGSFALLSCSTPDCLGGTTRSGIGVGTNEQFRFAVGNTGTLVVAKYFPHPDQLDLSACDVSSCNGAIRLKTFAAASGGIASVDVLEASAAGGGAVIAYRDQELHLGRCMDAGCASYASVPLGASFRPSVAVGLDGRPIATLWTEPETLAFARCRTAACDTGADVAELAATPAFYSKVLVPADGRPLIGFSTRVGTSRRIVAIKCGDAACASGNVATVLDDLGESRVVHYLGASLAGDGTGVFVYGVMTAGSALPPVLKIAKCGNSACTAGNRVRAAVGVGYPVHEAVVATGGDGVPVVAYRNALGIHAMHCGPGVCY